MSQGNQTTATDTQTTNPYTGAKGLLDTVMKDAKGLYKTNQLDPYSGLNGVQTQGLAGLINSAKRGVGSIDLATDFQRRMMGGAGDISTANQDELFGNVRGIARGDYLNRPDENFEKILGTMRDQAETSTAMQMAQRGRYGSDLHQGTLAREIGNIEAGQRYQNYQNERDRQMAANQLGLSIANSGSSIQGANMDRRSAAANTLPGLADARVGLYDVIKGAGDDYNADAYGRMSTRANNLKSLAGLLGIAAPYGTTNTNSVRREPNNPLQTVGTIGGLASLFF